MEGGCPLPPLPPVGPSLGDTCGHAAGSSSTYTHKGQGIVRGDTYGHAGSSSTCTHNCQGIVCGDTCGHTAGSSSTSSPAHAGARAHCVGRGGARAYYVGGSKPKCILECAAVLGGWVPGTGGWYRSQVQGGCQVQVGGTGVRYRVGGTGGSGTGWVPGKPEADLPRWQAAWV